MRISPSIVAGLVPLLTARLRDDGTLVDLAAGDGELIAAVAAVRPSATLLAYERDLTLVAAARARQLERATIALFDLSLDRPPPARGRVDVVVSPFVLGAQPEDSALLTHLRRLLREGGLLVAIEPDELTAQRVAQLLARRGFTIESVEPGGTDSPREADSRPNTGSPPKTARPEQTRAPARLVVEGRERVVAVCATPDLSRVAIGGIRGWDTG